MNTNTIRRAADLRLGYVLDLNGQPMVVTGLGQPLDTQHNALSVDMTITLQAADGSGDMVSITCKDWTEFPITHPDHLAAPETRSELHEALGEAGFDIVWRDTLSRGLHTEQDAQHLLTTARSYGQR